MSWTDRLKKAVGREGEAEAAAEATGAPAARVEAGDLSRDQLVALLRDDLVEISEGKLGADEIDPKGHLFDYGYVDSLSAVVFLARIEDRFGIQIEDMELIETLTCLDAIADRVQQAG